MCNFDSKLTDPLWRQYCFSLTTALVHLADLALKKVVFFLIALDAITNRCGRIRKQLQKSRKWPHLRTGRIPKRRRERTLQLGHFWKSGRRHFAVRLPVLVQKRLPEQREMSWSAEPFLLSLQRKWKFEHLTYRRATPQLLLPPLGKALTPDVSLQLFRKLRPPLSPPLQKHVVSTGRPHTAWASEADTPQITPPTPPEACNTLTLSVKQSGQRWWKPHRSFSHEE